MRKRKIFIIAFCITCLSILGMQAVVIHNLMNKAIQKPLISTYHPRMIPSPLSIKMEFDSVEKTIAIDSDAANYLLAVVDDAFGNAHQINSTKKTSQGFYQHDADLGFIRLEYNEHNSTFSYHLQDMDGDQGWFVISCSAIVFREDPDTFLRAEVEKPILYSINGKSYDEPRQLENLTIYLPGSSYLRMLEALDDKGF